MQAARQPAHVAVAPYHLVQHRDDGVDVVADELGRSALRRALRR